MVPPKIAMTALVGRLSRQQGVLAVHKEDLAGDQVAIQRRSLGNAHLPA
jgi:hypothetical protein